MFWNRNPEPTLAVGGETVRLLRPARQRRMTLTFEPHSRTAVLRLPPRTALATARRFLESQADWLAAQRARWPEPPPLGDGASLLFDGRTLTLRHDPGLPRRPVLAGDRLQVGGPAEQLEGRIARWLQAAARADLPPRVAGFAAARNRENPPVTLRDTRSRWGSCSASGQISLCWRLIGAPVFVRDYVCAHEVAHLAHLDHSPAFWREVALLGVDAKTGRAWLRAHGGSLLGLGRT